MHKTLLYGILILATAGSSWAATPATVAVVGLKTYAPQGSACAWVGVALAEGLAGRLTRTKTGIRQVERVDVAQILRMRGLPAVDQEGADAATCSQIAEAVRHLDELADQAPEVAMVSLPDAGTEATAQPTMPQARLLSANRLILGALCLDRPWGQGGNLLATIRVVNVETGALIPNSGAEAQGQATVEGLQQVECELAGKLCFALGGNISEADLKPHALKSEAYQRHAESRRLLLEGKYGEAIKLTTTAWDVAEVSLDMLPELMRTETEAYHGAIAEAELSGKEATSKELREQWAQREKALRERCREAKLEAKVKCDAADAAACFELAEDYVFGMDYYKAIPEYQEAIRKGKNDYVTWYALGSCQSWTYQIRAAIASYTKALGLKPGDDETYRARGYQYHQAAEYDRAIADFDSAIAANSESVWSYIYRGTTYFAQKNYDRGLKDFDKAVTLSPNDPAIYYQRAEALFYLKGDAASALTDFNKAIALKPDESKSYFKRGAAYYSKGQYDRAIADYDKTIALSPDYVWAYGQRACARAWRKDWDGALADSARAMALAPAIPHLHVTRAWIYRQMGDFEKALAECALVVALIPDSESPYNCRAGIYVAMGQYDKAIADCDKAIALNDKNAESYGKRGAAYFMKGDQARARSDLQKSLDLGLVGPPSIKVRMMLALCGSAAE
ncbi:MAG: tetratricopeptide repeat protein [Armatimonadota bacterium]